MSDLPALWALNKATTGIGERNWEFVNEIFSSSNPVILSIIAHARTIEKHEEPPVDPDLVWARDWASSNECNIDHMRDIMDGLWDGDDIIQNAIAVRKMSRKEWGIK